ncbi:hypothetical protein BH11PLA1_BH11PLA1_18190 [soil metagenome]
MKAERAAKTAKPARETPRVADADPATVAAVRRVRARLWKEAGYDVAVAARTAAAAAAGIGRRSR